MVKLSKDLPEFKGRVLNPQFVKEIRETQEHGKFAKVKDFAKEFGLK